MEGCEFRFKSGSFFSLQIFLQPVLLFLSLLDNRWKLSGKMLFYLLFCELSHKRVYVAILT